MQDSTLSQIVQVGTGLGVGGIVTAIVGHLFGRRKSDADAGETEARTDKTRAETQNTLGAPIEERLKALLEADGNRLAQMSDALAQQSETVLLLQRALLEQAPILTALSSKVDLLEASVRTLVRHIGSLENILRSKQIEPPPRPDLHPVAENVLS